MRTTTRPGRAAAAGLLLFLSACGGPLGPLAGGALSGNEAQTPDSWAFARDVEVIQLETRPDDPYSVNVWIGIVDGELYVPTSLILGEEDPAQRDWVQHVQQDPNVRLRIGENIYAATATRVHDEGTIAAVKDAMLAKYAEAATEHSNAAWVFRMEGR